MRATDAIQVARQIPQPPGLPCRVDIQTECRICRLPVAKPRLTAGGEPYRRHKRRLPNGELCPHGWTERDPVGTRVAF